MNEEQFRMATQHFYREPSPALATAALDYFLHGTDLWSDASKGAKMAYFFCRVAQTDLRALPIYRDLRAKLDAPRLQYVDRILHACETGEVPDPLSRPLRSPADLDVCWMEFAVTGDLAPVRYVASVLDWEDGLRQTLEGWYASRGKSWLGKRSVKALLSVGIDFDSETGAILNDNDMDLHCWLLADRQRIPIFKLLPMRLPEHDTNRMAIKGAAIWSLQAQAREHELVLQCCVEEAQRPGGAGRRYLTEVA